MLTHDDSSWLIGLSIGSLQALHFGSTGHHMGTMWLFQGMVNDMPFVTIMASDYVEFNVYQCLIVVYIPTVPMVQSPKN